MEVKEVWKDVVGYEGLYQVSNLGRVKSIDRIIERNGFKALIKGKVLKPKIDIYGYNVVVLTKNKIRKSKFVHRLVGLAFIECVDLNMQINHIDGNKTNNLVYNIEFVTPSENQKHAYRIGVKKALEGENHQNSKLTKAEVLQIRHIFSEGGITQYKLSKMYGVSQICISKIIRRITWKHI